MKARSRSKELLHLEHKIASPPSPGAKWLSICEPGKTENVSLKTVPLLAESTVLNKVKAFLPILGEANRTLEKAIKEKGADNFDIEVLKEHEETSYVELDLALGVAELYSDEAILAAQRVAGGQILSTTSRASEDSDCENYDSQSKGVAARRKKPRIESLG